jgi:hypothetical protein
MYSLTVNRRDTTSKFVETYCSHKKSASIALFWQGYWLIQHWASLVSEVLWDLDRILQRTHLCHSQLSRISMNVSRLSCRAREGRLVFGTSQNKIHQIWTKSRMWIPMKSLSSMIPLSLIRLWLSWKTDTFCCLDILDHPKSTKDLPYCTDYTIVQTEHLLRLILKCNSR